MRQVGGDFSGPLGVVLLSVDFGLIGPITGEGWFFMLQELPVLAMTAWLSELSAQSMREDPFPLHQLLQDSLYYPSCGFDGDPVKYLGGNILSFIYVDYGRTRDEEEYALGYPGFRGYDLLASRSVTEQELTPNGWHPIPPTYDDGDPLRFRQWVQRPFCTWSIFQRREDIPPEHGPSRFSLLYLGADGVAAFQALYLANHAAPRAIAIIQPGHAFGGNWTDYTNPNLILHRSVIGNSAGQPEVLLYGGYGEKYYYKDPCWPKYNKYINRLDKSGHGSIGVWRYISQCSH